MANVDLDMLKLDVQRALDAVMAALLRLERLPGTTVPEDALNMALDRDPTYQAARVRLRAVQDRVQSRLGPDGLNLFMELEECGNAVVSKAINVTWSLAAHTFARSPS